MGEEGQTREMMGNPKLNPAQSRGHQKHQKGDAQGFPGKGGEGASEATGTQPPGRESGAISPRPIAPDNYDTSCLQSPAEGTGDQYITPRSHTPCSSNTNTSGNMLPLNLRSLGPSNWDVVQGMITRLLTPRTWQGALS